MIGRKRCLSLLLTAVSMSVLITPAAAQIRVSPEPVLAWADVLTGDRETRLRWPTSIASAAADEICVADVYGSRLVLFRNEAGTVDWKVERTVTLDAAPFGLAFDGSRYLVSFRNQAALAAFEPTTLLRRNVSLPTGVEAGALASAGNGEVLVHDRAGRRILRLAGIDLRGEVPIAGHGHLTALAAAPGGGFYAAFAGVSEVRRYAPNGEIMNVWSLPGAAPDAGWPTGLAVATDGEILVADRHSGRILVLEPGGTSARSGSRRGREPGLLRFPSALVLLADGRLAVADQGNGRVQIFRRLEPPGSP